MSFESKLQDIFYIKNVEEHKVINFLGVKLKFFNSKKANERIKKEIADIKKEIMNARNGKYVSKVYLNNLLNYFVDIKASPKARGSLRELQLLEIYLLRRLKQICIKIKVKFWLRGGSCLGAFRHKGMTPWDDDIDLGIMRDDFDRLYEYVNNNETEYEIKYYYHNDCKVAKFVFRNEKNLPVFVDLFPFDFCSYENYYELNKKWHEDKNILIRKIKALNFKQGYTESVPAKIIKTIEKYNDYYKNQYIYSKDKTGICYAIEQVLASHDTVFPVEWIFPFKELEYEGDKYFVPNNIDEYLKFYYGEYMNFPINIEPEKHRFMFNPEDFELIHAAYLKYYS